MSITFGKTQLNLRQINDESSDIVKSKILCSNKITKIFGFGPRKTQWILSSIGASQNLRVGNFFSRDSVLNRERKLEKSIARYCKQFVGLELKQILSRAKTRSNHFRRAQRSPIIMQKKKRKNKLFFYFLF